MKTSDLNIKKIRPGASFILLYLLGVGILETILRIGILGNDHFSLPSLYINTMLFALFFGVIITILSFVLPEKKISCIIKDISRYFWILGLNPLFSYYFYGEISERITSTEPIILFLLIFLLSSLFGLKMFFRVGISKSIVSSVVIFAASLPVFMINQGSWLEGTQPYFQLHLLIVILLLENLVIYSFFCYKFFSQTFTKVLKSIKVLRTLHFVMIVILGIIFVRQIAPKEALSFTSINHFPFIFLPVFCLVLLWQFTTLLNDLYDLEIDRQVHPNRPLVSEKFDRKLYTDILISIALLSSFLSFLIGLPLLILNIAALLLAILYSVPPFRLRNRPYGHICVGLGSVIGFLFGVYSPIYLTDRIYRYTPALSSDIPFFSEVFTVSILIVVVLSISPLINALSDYEGDKRSGVRNVYTVLGFERGKKIVSILIVFLFISPLLLFNSTLDLVFMLSTGLISSVVFYRFEDHRPVFGIYFIVLFYLILKFISYI